MREPRSNEGGKKQNIILKQSFFLENSLLW